MCYQQTESSHMKQSCDIMEQSVKHGCIWEAFVSILYIHDSERVGLIKRGHCSLAPAATSFEQEMLTGTKNEI